MVVTVHIQTMMRRVRSLFVMATALAFHYTDAHFMAKSKAGFVHFHTRVFSKPQLKPSSISKTGFVYSRHFTRGKEFQTKESDHDEIKRIDGSRHHEESYQACLQRRQFLLLASLAATQLPLPANSMNGDNVDQNYSLTIPANYQKSPINKRLGITLSEPERIYPINFITYLSRFLLVFDPECQAWWYTQASAIPKKSSQSDVDRLRLDQFGQFAASVEVGLVDFEGERGPATLLEELVRRYADVSLQDAPAARKDPFSSFITGSAMGNSTQPTLQQQQKIRRKKEALRQIALMFSLLKDYQPVDLITQLLAADDDAKIDEVVITDGGAGYLPPEISSPPKISFPNPPTFGTVFGGSVAQGTVNMEVTGRILKLDVTNGGSGYEKPPNVEISIPNSVGSESSRATAKAILGKGKSKGSVERIDLLNFGMGYSSKNAIVVSISPPESSEGETASAKAILEYNVVGVDILDPGRGYAAERPVRRIIIDPPPDLGIGFSRPATAVSYPRGRSTSFKSFMGDADNYLQTSDASESNWVIGPTSSQILTLLPSGVGLNYDTSLKRYILSTAQNDFEGSLFGEILKPLNPIFGIRGRSPIEKQKNLDTSTVIRFIASGAVCSSVAHLALTPIDVVKTKVQTKPDVYNGGVIETFKKVLNEEGAKTFFDGWEPTFVGFFFTGGVAFFFTEYFRRVYTSFAVSYMVTQSSMTEVGAAAVANSSLEIPLVAAAAASSGLLCCFLLAPFDAIRIRRVTEPDFADSIVGVVNRIVKEEGFLSLFSALNAWILKEVPYNVVKFIVFDSFTEWAYAKYPVAQEDIRLSLAVSLVGGTCGGIAAAVVSNPADVIVSTPFFLDGERPN